MIDNNNNNNNTNNNTNNNNNNNSNNNTSNDNHSNNNKNHDHSNNTILQYDNPRASIDPQGEAARLLVESHLAWPLAVPNPISAWRFMGSYKWGHN